jgi:hypothetical protein
MMAINNESTQTGLIHGEEQEEDWLGHSAFQIVSFLCTDMAMHNLDV